MRSIPLRDSFHVPPFEVFIKAYYGAGGVQDVGEAVAVDGYPGFPRDRYAHPGHVVGPNVVFLRGVNDVVFPAR